MSGIRQIIINTLTGWVAIALKAGIAFMMVPFLLTRLGKDGYGLIGILGVLVGLSNIADLGLRSALGRELTEKVAVKDNQGFNELVTTSLLIYVSIGVSFCLLVSSMAPWLSVLFKVPASLIDEAVTLIRIYATGSIMLSFITPVFTAVLSSYHRFDLINSVQIMVNLVFSLLIFIAVWFANNGLFAWVYVMLLNQLAILLLTCRFAGKSASFLEIRSRHVKLSSMKPLLKLGGVMYVLHLTKMLSEASDPLVISFFFGTAGVALYQPGCKLSQIARPVVTTMSSQLFPLTTRQHVQKEQGKMQQLLVLGTKYTLILGVFAVVVMIAIAYPLCRLWLSDSLGAEWRVVAQVLIGWALADFTAYAMGSQWAVLLGMKRLNFLLWTMVPTAILNLLISIYLVGHTKLGIPGVLVATVLVGFIRRPVVGYYTARICGMRVRDYVTNAYVGPILVLVLLGACAFVLRLLICIDSWVMLIAFCLLVLLCWVFLTWVIALNRLERKMILDGIRDVTRSYHVFNKH